MKPFHPVVAGDLRNHRARRRGDAVFAVLDQLERRLFLSGTLTPIVTFNGVDGAIPNDVVQDASGDLFGVTESTYANPNANGGPGVFFEIPANTGAIKDLNVFGTEAGATSTPTSLIIDSSGNLYGILVSDVAGTPATVFELPAGATTAMTLATFATTDPEQLTAVDSAGNLYGIDNASQVFEVVKNSGVVTPLTDVSDQIQQLIADLELGPDGNLYGVTYGPATTSADLFKITPSNGNLQVLATFDPTTSGNMPLGLTFDSSGNIWGFCEQGGPNGDGTYGSGSGTVWEFPLPVTSANPTISFVAQFTQASGLTVVSRPAFDSAGNLYGLTEDGGANGNGTVFGLAAGSTTLTDLYDWVGSDPDLPEGIVTTSNGVAAVEAATTANDVQTVQPQGIHPNGFNGIEIWNCIVNTQLTGMSLESDGTVDYLTQGIVTRLALKKFRQALVDMKADPDFTDWLVGEASATVVGLTSSEVRRVGLAIQQTGVSGQIAQIKAMIRTNTRELIAVNPQVNLDTNLLAQETKEGDLITALEAQLAAQTNSAKQAAIQKKITADTAVQTRVTNEEDAVYNKALAALNNIQTLENNITAALAALPAPFAELAFGITSVPALINPGKKGIAVVTVTNSGNVPVTLSFQMVLSARPQGTTGSADVTLGTDTIRLHRLASGGSVPERLSFLIPKTFPAGTYSLVAVPIINSTLTGTATPVVSTVTFTVP